MKKPLYRGYFFSKDLDAKVECHYSCKVFKEEVWGFMQDVIEEEIEVVSAWDYYTGEEIDPNLIPANEVEVDVADGPINYDPEDEPYEFRFKKKIK